MKKVFFTIGLFLCLISALAVFPSAKSIQNQYSKAELDQLFAMHSRMIDTNAIFLPNTSCKGCHGFDPQGIAMVDVQGNDVNLYDDWETSMMGLSGVDPLWKAKVHHEMAVNPSHAAELQNLCTSCHAPMGHYNAFYRNQGLYTLDHLATDSLGLSGVGCLSCHAIGEENLGKTFSGQIPYDTTRKAYGPFPGPMVGPMQLYTNFTPVYSPHVSEGKFCSPCHTLITNTVDLEGTPTANTYVEQATYHEWLNSVFPNQGRTCQSCHMPQIEDPVKIAVGYIAIPGRSPFNLHTFAGANEQMVRLIKNNKQALGISASEANFDSTLKAINRMLRNETIDLSVETPEFSNDTARFAVRLRNKAGHKFPSGYPARKAFVQFVVKKLNGDTLFASGLFNNQGYINGENATYEPHYQIIKNPDQVQIYQIVMGDVNNNPTTVLERGALSLKDNRIPPFGFTTTHSVYDTTLIVGNALSDVDFNKNGSTEGSGADVIHYHIPMNGNLENISVSVKVYFQAVPPTWLNEMRGFSSTFIDAFLDMYDNNDNTPFLVRELNLNNVVNPLSSSQVKNDDWKIFPNPVRTNSKVQIQANHAIQTIKIFDATGKLVYSEKLKSYTKTHEIIAPLNKGLYLMSVETEKSKLVKKVLVND